MKRMKTRAPLRLSTLRPIGAALLLAATCTIVATAGPPLVCHPIEIGEAKSLPWSSGAFGADKNYDTERLVPDTLELLEPDTPVIERMETLRRAAIYAGEGARSQRDASARALKLLCELQARALNAASEADGNGESDAAANAMAWFDAGYLAQIYRQFDILPPHTETFDGYAWASRAATAMPQNGEIHLALAIICEYPHRPEQDHHLKQAVALAEPGSRLAINIERQFHASIEELRHRFARR